MSDHEAALEDAAVFGQTNVAVWVLTTAAGLFLAVRIYCRCRFSKPWWDDVLLTVSYFILLSSAALVSRTIINGYGTEEEQRRFLLYQNTWAALTAIATAWTKVAFAITLSRIMHHRLLKLFLWFVMITANLMLIPTMLAIWTPACEDPRKVLRPQHSECFPLVVLRYMGGTTIVYGGVIDVLLALIPWFVIKGLLLETREKIGLSVAMSMGFITGIVVIFRAFFQLKKIDNNFHYLVFMSIFQFLEPCVTLIAQAIPMFRALVVKVKSSSIHRLSSPDDIMLSASTRLPPSWTSKGHDEQHEVAPQQGSDAAGPAGRDVDDDLERQESRRSRKSKSNFVIP
ncbi:hypothetical protein VTJ83DRAFT_7572 [Remersonia thermophila]|uniref:Rhodopsin domain-containing protein n=1 Tax=Remersonia thermophila TaxID=72144 RepID=A0ABR4D433_9PEZI